MKQLTARGISYSLCIYLFLHYLTILYPSDLLLACLSVAGIATLLFTGLHLPFRTFALPLFLIAIALLIQLFTGGSVTELLIEGVKEMRSLIALLLIVPIISWILEEEPYVEAIMNQFHNFLHTSSRFYFGMMFINQIISFFLLFGAIPMMYQFMNGFLQEKKGEAWEYLKGTALLRSFSLTTLWVVSIPSFAFAVDHLGASLGWAILQGFSISLLGLFIAVAFAGYKEKKYHVNYTRGIEEELEELAQKVKDKSKWSLYVKEFGLLFLLLFGTVFTVHILSGWSLLLIIPPVIIILTIVFFGVKKKSRLFIKRSKEYASKEISYRSMQFSLMLAAGTLIFSVNQSGIGNYLIDGLFYAEGSIPFVNFLTILPLIVIFLGFLGLGPLTVIVLVAGILENIELPYPPELIVLSMTSGSVISVLLSPLILPIIVLSTSNGLGVIKNGFSFNWAYALVFYILVQLYLQVTALFLT